MLSVFFLEAFRLSHIWHTECTFLLLDLTHEKWYIFLYLTHKGRIFRVKESLLFKHIDDIDREAYKVRSGEIIDMTTELVPIHASSSLSTTQDHRYTSMSYIICYHIRYDSIGKKRLLFFKNLFYFVF
jgi:hypothetical protein